MAIAAAAAGGVTTVEQAQQVLQDEHQKELNDNQKALNDQWKALEQGWDKLDPAVRAERLAKLEAAQDIQDEAQKAHQRIEDGDMEKAWKGKETDLAGIVAASERELGLSRGALSMAAEATGKTVGGVTALAGMLDTAATGQAGDADGWISLADLRAAKDNNLLTADERAVVGTILDTAEKQGVEGISTAEFMDQAKTVASTPGASAGSGAEEAPAETTSPAAGSGAEEAPAETTSPAAPSGEQQQPVDGAAAGGGADPAAQIDAYIAEVAKTRATTPQDAIDAIAKLGDSSFIDAAAYGDATQAALKAAKSTDPGTSAQGRLQLQALGFVANNPEQLKPETTFDASAWAGKDGQTLSGNIQQYAVNKRTALAEFMKAEDHFKDNTKDGLLGKDEATDPASGLAMTQEQFNAVAGADGYMSQDEYVAGRLSGTIGADLSMQPKA